MKIVKLIFTKYNDNSQYENFKKFNELNIERIKNMLWDMYSVMGDSIFLLISKYFIILDISETITVVNC